jgi:hypothetical protein
MAGILDLALAFRGGGARDRLLWLLRVIDGDQTLAGEAMDMSGQDAEPIYEHSLLVGSERGEHVGDRFPVGGRFKRCV